MSPGSFVSSESAGSSNSLDDPDDPGARILTPIEDNMPPATIFEESSAESCIEQTSDRRRAELGILFFRIIMKFFFSKIETTTVVPKF